jgi:DNA-binding MarR family transcriptional regulator
VYMGTAIYENPVSADAIGDQAQELMRRLELLSGNRVQDNISIGQYRMMSLIHAHGSISVGSLGKLSGSAQSTTSEMAARLTKTGLVTKVRGPDDGRVVMLALTEQGRQLMRRRKKTLREAYQKLMDSLVEDEKHRFAQAVWELNDILAAASAEQSLE